MKKYLDYDPYDDEWSPFDKERTGPDLVQMYLGMSGYTKHTNWFGNVVQDPYNGGISILTGMNVELGNDYAPHYTNTAFDGGPLLIWVRSKSKPPKIGWDYSDRLWQWDYKKHEDAWAKVEEEYGKRSYTQTTPAQIEKYLSYFFDKPIELWGVAAGVSSSSGYPYQIFGYRVVEQGEQA